MHIEVDIVSSGSNFLYVELLSAFLALSHGFRDLFEVSKGMQIRGLEIVRAWDR